MCKKKRDSVKYLRRWISVAAATAALPTPRILTKYSRSFIRFRRNISISLARAHARTLFSDGTYTLRISTNETFRGNDESNKSWKSTIPTLAKNLSRAVTRLFYLASLDHVTGTLLLYIRDAVPTFSRFLFRCRRNFVREPPFLRPTPNLAHARFVPPSTELLPAEEVTGSNYRKITDYLFQGRSIKRKQE